MSLRDERAGQRLTIMVILVALALTLLLVASSVRAASRPTLHVRPSVASAGGRVLVAGTGFRANRSVYLYVGQPRSEVDLIKTLRASAHGGFRTRVPIGRWVAPGRYVLMACQLGCRVKVSVNFRIVRAAGASDRTTLAGAAASRRMGR